NVIRLILGNMSDGDNEKNNRYTRAASFLEQWLSEGALTQDESDSIYVYMQDYRMVDGTLKTRTGFIALAKLEDFSSGKILPHEKTLSGPKTDRLNLMKSCHCNFSQIFSLYSDKSLSIDQLIAKSIEGKNPDMDVTDVADIRHRIFRVSDAGTVSKVVSLMKDKRLFIADGHHRYETALNFRNYNSENGELPADSPYNYVMMYFANMDNDGLVVFPTHRVLFNLDNDQINFLKSEVDTYFSVVDFPFNKENELSVRDEFAERLTAEGETKHAFGMYVKGDKSYHLLIAEDTQKIESVLRDDMDSSLRELDVTVLHSVIIDHLLGVGTKAQENQENLKYVKNVDKAIELVKDGDFQVTFLLNPTKIDQVKSVASAGNKMPQKSTFFYPKLLTGLVINKLNS
ncbi:DUF1015 domain-containing protein, partial [Thermodesulfobacteriota bacterium]